MDTKEIKKVLEKIAGMSDGPMDEFTMAGWMANIHNLAIETLKSLNDGKEDINE